MKIITFLFGLLIFTTPVAGEIYKLAIPGENGINFYWWPAFPPVEGWHHDRDLSLHYSFNAQAPDGFTFSNAETVIYASALYKQRMPETTSLEILIEDDKKKFLSSGPQIEIKRFANLSTGDNQELKTYLFEPIGEGNWELVAYGEEGDFYLIFTLSSRSESGFENNLNAFEEFVSNYKEKP